MTESSTDDDMSDDEHSSGDEDDKKESYITNIFRNLIVDAINEHEEKLTSMIAELEQERFSKKSAIKRAILKSEETTKTLRRLYRH